MCVSTDVHIVVCILKNYTQCSGQSWYEKWKKRVFLNWNQLTWLQSLLVSIGSPSVQGSVLWLWPDNLSPTCCLVSIVLLFCCRGFLSASTLLFEYRNRRGLFSSVRSVYVTRKKKEFVDKHTTNAGGRKRKRLVNEMNDSGKIKKQQRTLTTRNDNKKMRSKATSECDRMEIVLWYIYPYASCLW